MVNPVRSHKERAQAPQCPQAHDDDGDEVEEEAFRLLTSVFFLFVFGTKLRLLPKTNSTPTPSSNEVPTLRTAA